MRLTASSRCRQILKILNPRVVPALTLLAFLFPRQNVQWMDAATKAEALIKINALSPQVGRQDSAFDDR
jgi:hypothetical protein